MWTNDFFLQNVKQIIIWEKQGKHDFCFLSWELPWHQAASCNKVSIIFSKIQLDSLITRHLNVDQTQPRCASLEWGLSAHTQGSLSKRSLSQSAMFSGGEIVSLDRELTGIVFAINLHPAGGQVRSLSSFTTLSSSSASIQLVVNRFSFWWSFTWLNLKDVVGRLVIQDFWQTRERDFFFLPTGVYRCVCVWLSVLIVSRDPISKSWIL